MHINMSYYMAVNRITHHIRGKSPEGIVLMKHKSCLLCRCTHVQDMPAPALLQVLASSGGDFHGFGVTLSVFSTSRASE
jgi:hypothetical protein